MADLVTKIDHICVVVSDLEKSIQFYEKHLGFTIKDSRKLNGKWVENVMGLSAINAEFASLGNENSNAGIELLQFSNPLGEKIPSNKIPNTVGIRHIAFATENIELIFSSFSLDYLLGSKKIIENPFGKKMFYALGLDDEIIEVCQYKK